MRKLLHIINNEKFVNTTISQFEGVKNAECYFLLPVKHIKEASHVAEKYHANENIYCQPYNTTAYYQTIQEINPDFLIIHGLSVNHKRILRKVGNQFKVVWNSWGRDIFSTKKLSDRMYKPKTAQWLKKEEGKKSLKKRVGEVVYWFLREENRMPQDSKHYLKYINVMSTVVKEDYDTLIANFSEAQHISYIPFNYGGFLNQGPIQERGENILIGNSANQENNHLESFDYLNKVNLLDKKVIVPLSYGGNPAYINEIKTAGQNQLKNHFLPLIEFMNKDAYLDLLNSVGYAIMNHSHQHAMGNIWFLLSNGVKVFMDFNNTAAQSLLRLGVIIFDLKNFEANQLVPLTTAQQEHNKAILLQEYGVEAIQRRTQEYVDHLLGQ